MVTATVIGEYSGISLPGIQFVRKNEHELIFHADDGAATLPLTKESLLAQGIPVMTMTVRSPSRDEVFLHLAWTEEDTCPNNLSSFRNKTGRR